MAIALRATTAGTSKTTGTSLALAPVSVVTNDLLVVVYTTQQTAFDASAISDNQAQPWTSVVAALAGAKIKTYVWTRRATASGSLAITITHASTSEARAAVGGVFSGVKQLAPILHGAAALINDNNSPYTRTLGAASEIGELALGFFGLRGPGTDTIAATAPHTLAISAGTSGGSANANALAALTWYLTVDGTTPVIPTLTDPASRQGIAGGVFARGVYGSLTLVITPKTAQLRHARRLTASAGALTMTPQPAVTMLTSRAYGDFGDRFSGWVGNMPVVQLGDSREFDGWLGNQQLVIQVQRVSIDGPPTLVASPGVLTITTQAALTMRRTYRLIAAAGSLTITGNEAITLHAPVRLPAETGEFAIDGTDALLIRTHRALTAAPGALTITGGLADFVFRVPFSCAPGALTIMGHAADFIVPSVTPPIDVTAGGGVRILRRIVARGEFVAAPAQLDGEVTIRITARGTLRAAPPAVRSEARLRLTARGQLAGAPARLRGSGAAANPGEAVILLDDDTDDAMIVIATT